MTFTAVTWGAQLRVIALVAAGTVAGACSDPGTSRTAAGEPGGGAGAAAPEGVGGRAGTVDAGGSALSDAQPGTDVGPIDVRDAAQATEVTAAKADSAVPNCQLPVAVSYQKDVQSFLATSCGGGNGCHVIDAVSTAASGGYNHGYDWITAGAHASSCPTVPKRFEIVIDVINAANPPTCSKSRQMPPPDATGAGKRAPLTACQIATLQSWLNEPLVTQLHRPDDSSPTTPYPMPPFN